MTCYTVGGELVFPRRQNRVRAVLARTRAQAREQCHILLMFRDVSAFPSSGNATQSPDPLLKHDDAPKNTAENGINTNETSRLTYRGKQDKPNRDQANLVLLSLAPTSTERLPRQLQR